MRLAAVTIALWAPWFIFVHDNSVAGYVARMLYASGNSVVVGYSDPKGSRTGFFSL